MKHFSFIKNIFFFSILIIAFFGFSQNSFALSEMYTQTDALAGEQGGQLGAARDPRFIVANLIRTSIGLLGIGFTAYMVYAGYLIMTAGGDSSRISKGKDTMQTAATGIVIMFCSYMIVLLISRIALGDPFARQTGELKIYGEDESRFEQDYQYDRPDENNFYAPPNMHGF